MILMSVPNTQYFANIFSFRSLSSSVFRLPRRFYLLKINRGILFSNFLSVDEFVIHDQFLHAPSIKKTLFYSFYADSIVHNEYVQKILAFHVKRLHKSFHESNFDMKRREYYFFLSGDQRIIFHIFHSDFNFYVPPFTSIAALISDVNAQISKGI